MRSYFVDGLHFAFLFLLLAFMLAGFAGIPYGAVIPVHWNWKGEIDGTLPREWALLVPVAIGLLLWGVFLLMRRYKGNASVAASRYVLGAAITGTTGLLCLVEATIALVGMGTEVPVVRVAALAIAVFLIFVGNSLPKSQPNHWAGIRVRWTLDDARNWQLTHRFAGIAWILAGVGLGLVALLVSSAPILSVAVLAALLLPNLGAVGYSYWLTLRSARDTRA